MSIGFGSGAVNDPKGSSGSPKGAALSLQFRHALLKPWVVMLLGLVIAITLGIVAEFLYSGSSPESFRRKLAESLLQLALIVVIGALINFLFDVYSARRASLEEKNNQRTELLRRVRAAHVTIAYAQRLIAAHDSGLTYTRQLRDLMIVTFKLEDIAEDVRAAENLFKPDDATIISGIEGIVKFLNKGAGEYVQNHSDVDSDAKSGKDLTSTINRCKMSWIKDFVESRKSPPGFPDLYFYSLTKSKGNMRKHVYSGKILSVDIDSELHLE
jgi:hypothetical protein